MSSAAGSTSSAKRRAYRFVLLVGVLSFFADFTYEGARSVLGPYLGLLGASGFIIGVVTGIGEMLGYTLRLLSGRIADRTGRFWTVAIIGYVVQMVAVPALALTSTWPEAAALIILERIGRAIRNPPRDVMLSHAGRLVGGYGWAFGIHEALDQFGALFGPLLVAFVLAHGGQYHLAFATLLIPAVINLIMVGVARWLFPHPEEMEENPAGSADDRLSPLYWVYLGGAALVAAGFADYPLIAYHFQQSGAVQGYWIAIAYSIAMAVSGTGSLVFGRLFDRFGFKILIAVTVIAAAFAPLVFLSGFDGALLGVAVWGLGMGVHESIIPAAVTPLVPYSRRAYAFGLFTTGYGVAWFLGSAAIGFLYDRSIWATIAFCVGTQLLAVPIFIWVGARRAKEAPSSTTTMAAP